MTLDLSDEETAPLARLLSKTIDDEGIAALKVRLPGIAPVEAETHKGRRTHANILPVIEAIRAEGNTSVNAIAGELSAAFWFP